MKQIFSEIGNFWERMTLSGAIFTGIVLGVVLTAIPHAFFGEQAIIFGLLVYAPFHVRLTFLLFCIAFFKKSRARIVGEGYSQTGAVFAFIFTTKYSSFCIGWFWTTLLYLASRPGA